MFGIWPIGGRSTAIKLQDGGVWVLASTPLDAETKSKLQELGPVKCVIHEIFKRTHETERPLLLDTLWELIQSITSFSVSALLFMPCFSSSTAYATR